MGKATGRRDKILGKLDGKVALVTGGTSGIGAATVRLFQAEGAIVIATGRNQVTLDAARRDLPGIEIVASDAGDPAAARALIEAVTARHGHIDVLFVNAGVARFAPSEAVDEAFFDDQFAINVRGPFFLLKHAVPAMAEGGSIILTSSVSGVKGGVGQTVYAASKAALRSFGRTFAAELAPRRIRVNTISPGPVDTPIFEKIGLPEEAKAGLAERAAAMVPLGRVGQPDELAAAALFLASDDSAFITGTELFVDGGLASL
jgi:NAD(P)-dependent dehydrogenase (short-subunit alcohol dehydrogenase family)